MACTGSNENKMSDGGRGRVSIGVEVWKSSQKWSAQRSAVRSIAWLDHLLFNCEFLLDCSFERAFLPFYLTPSYGNLWRPRSILEAVVKPVDEERYGYRRTDELADLDRNRVPY